MSEEISEKIERFPEGVFDGDPEKKSWKNY